MNKKKLELFNSLFEQEIDGSFLGRPHKYTECLLSFSNLPPSTREVYIADYVAGREKTKYDDQEYDFLFDFLKKRDLEEAFFSRIKQFRKEILLKQDSDKNEIGYAYYTPQGEHIGCFDDNTYEPEEGLLFSSLTPEAQEVVLEGDIELFLDVDFSKEFLNKFLQGNDVLEDYQKYIREYFTNELVSEEAEGETLYFSDELKVKIMETLTEEDLKLLGKSDETIH